MNGFAQTLILTSKQRELRKGLPVLNLLLLISTYMYLTSGGGAGVPYKKDRVLILLST